MMFSLSSLSSDLKVPIVFVTWCYHTPSSKNVRVHSLLSYSISSVKDVIVFPSFHIFVLVDGQKKDSNALRVDAFLKKGGISV